MIPNRRPIPGKPGSGAVSRGRPGGSSASSHTPNTSSQKQQQKDIKSRSARGGAGGGACLSSGNLGTPIERRQIFASAAARTNATGPGKGKGGAFSAAAIGEKSQKTLDQWRNFSGPGTGGNGGRRTGASHASSTLGPRATGPGAGGGGTNSNDTVKYGRGELNDLMERIAFLQHTERDLRDFYDAYLNNTDDFRERIRERILLYRQRGHRVFQLSLSIMVEFIDPYASPVPLMPVELQRPLMQRLSRRCLNEDFSRELAALREKGDMIELGWRIFKVTVEEFMVVIGGPIEA